MKQILTLFIFSILIVSCSSKKESETKKTEEIKRQIDYVVQQSSSKKTPEWVEDFRTWEDGQNEKFEYFMDESEYRSKRLCRSSSNARAKKIIASETAEYINNIFAEAEKDRENSSQKVTRYSEEELSTMTKSFITGAKVYRRYWEKRKYLKAMGAEKDKVEYSCYTVVRMSKKRMKDLIDLTFNKIMGKEKNPEVKDIVKKLKDETKDAFNKSGM